MLIAASPLSLLWPQGVPPKQLSSSFKPEAAYTWTKEDGCILKKPRFLAQKDKQRGFQGGFGVRRGMAIIPETEACPSVRLRDVMAGLRKTGAWPGGRFKAGCKRCCSRRAHIIVSGTHKLGCRMPCRRQCTMSAFYMQGIRNAGTKRVVAPSRRIEPALIRGQCRNGDPLAKVLAGGGVTYGATYFRYHFRESGGGDRNRYPETQK